MTTDDRSHVAPLAPDELEAKLDALGTELRRRRMSANLTLDYIAQRSGLTPNYIGTIELGKRDPSVSSLIKIAHAFNCEVSDLFGSEGTPVCPRCGSPFDPQGACIKRSEGCQGGWGEAPRQRLSPEATEIARLYLKLPQKQQAGLMGFLRSLAGDDDPRSISR